MICAPSAPWHGKKPSMSNLSHPFMRNLPEGKGAILTFSKFANQEADAIPELMEHIQLVGTHDCRTCVGLYIKINETTCLMAHINATSKYRRLRNEMAPGDRAVFPYEGEQIYGDVLAMLNLEANLLNWDPTAKAQTKYVVCCPKTVGKARDGRWFKYTGYYVLAAIRTFLDKTESEFEWKSWGGFIVDQNTGDVVQKFPWDAEAYKREVTLGLEKYTVVDEVENVKDWKFENVN